ncbi:hypothetical protein NE237_030603 [Protea cynaroides]|uniref:Uncharacterized protein n=1 Tax=Protea cynaroides TaxID=273540 RepID=A0A9Q0GVD4_9MAGN|nr:hypothetical protein NE237_030603 [Protea cynaroides]
MSISVSDWGVVSNAECMGSGIHSVQPDVPVSNSTLRSIPISDQGINPTAHEAVVSGNTTSGQGSMNDWLPTILPILTIASSPTVPNPNPSSSTLNPNPSHAHPSVNPSHALPFVNPIF